VRARAAGWRGKALLLAVLALSLVVGATLRLQSATSRFAPDQCSPHDVTLYYVSTAESVLAGRGWVPAYKANYVPPPLQTVFVILIKTVAPDANYGTMRTVQAWLSVATILLAFWIGMQISSPWVGALAAALIAVDPGVVFWVSTLLPDSNEFFLLFASLGILLTAVERRSPRLIAASGGVLGLAALMKSFPLLLSVLIPLYLVARTRDRRTLALALAFFAAFALIVSPWLIRNYRRYGHWAPISTNSGTLLAQSNFLELDSREMIYWTPIKKAGVWKSPEIEARFAGRVDRYGKIEWNEKDRAYFRHALRYVLDHPAHFLRNYAIKLYNVFRYPLPHPGERWGPADVQQAAVILLGLAGFLWFAVAERRRSCWVMVPVFVYYAAFTALFHISRFGRFNLPVRVLLSFFAAYLIARLWIAARGSGGAPAPPQTPRDHESEELGSRGEIPSKTSSSC
jgi:4-amino-4-deoxy-L-arabinose transferase-like glycosyltransferase